MSVGCGWYEDEPENQNIYDDYYEFNALATQLLRDKLAEVFALAKNNPNRREVGGGRFYKGY